MTLDLNGQWIGLTNTSTLQAAKYAWPIEVVLRSLDLMGLLDVEFIDNGDSKAAIAVTKVIYEASASPSTSPGAVYVYDTANAQWAAATQALLSALLSDVGQTQANWTETDSNVSSYIQNRPADVTTETFLNKTAARLLINGEVWSALAPHALSISASAIAIDLNDGIDFTLTMSENAQLSNMENKQTGQRGIIRVTQDATGSRLMTFDTDYEFIGSSAFALSTGANDVDEISYRVIDSSTVTLAIDKNWG